MKYFYNKPYIPQLRFMLASIMLFLMLPYLPSCNNITQPENENASIFEQQNVIGTGDIVEGLFNNSDFVRTIKLAEPGRIHNAILDIFYSYHDPYSEEKLTAPEFVKLTVKSINTVLEKENIVVRVTELDVVKILKGFIKLGQKGMMNVFEPTREGLLSSFDCAVNNGYLDKDASKQYLNAILKTEKHNFSPNISNVEFRKKITCSTTNPCRDEMFLDILYHSYCFWSSIEREKLVLYSSLDTTQTDVRDLVTKITAYGTDVLYNVLGIVMFPVTVGGSLILVGVSTIASIAMECLMDDFIGWLDEQL